MAESPDRVIFLGDYVSTHEDIPSSRQIENLNGILDYKESHADCVTLLRGNHDLQHLGYPWAECSGLDGWVLLHMPRERYLAQTQWVYIDDELRTVFSHAGISEVWMRRHGIADIHHINAMPPSGAFGFSTVDPWDMYGEHPSQPPTWIRPQTLAGCCLSEWNQVVGHTPVRKIFNLRQALGLSQHIWLCDAMGMRQYLLIDGEEFIPKQWP